MAAQVAQSGRHVAGILIYRNQRDRLVKTQGTAAIAPVAYFTHMLNGVSSTVRYLGILTPPARNYCSGTSRWRSGHANPADLDIPAPKIQRREHRTLYSSPMASFFVDGIDIGGNSNRAGRLG